MVALLSPEWLDRRRDLGAGLPERPGASARLQHIVSGAPDGPVAYVEVFEDGRLTAASWGPAEVSAVDVTINETYADAVAIARGELDLHVGFMQGRVKIVGPMGALMAVLPATQSSEHKALVQQLADQADR
jgi:hypothetical protein